MIIPNIIHRFPRTICVIDNLPNIQGTMNYAKKNYSLQSWANNSAFYSSSHSCECLCRVQNMGHTHTVLLRIILSQLHVVTHNCQQVVTFSFFGSQFTLADLGLQMLFCIVQIQISHSTRVQVYVINHFKVCSILLTSFSY